MHERFMQSVLELAQRGAGWTAPNPLVGAILVRQGQVIAEGYHERYGGPHAEVNVIQKVTDSTVLKNATLYVNLEPCNHYGKTPPCTNLIIQSGIPQVVIGCLDPHAKVSGQGISTLQEAGIDVVVGVEEARCRELNKRFFTYHQKKRPYIILKWAQTKDGYIAKLDGNSKWISSEASRALTHAFRAEEAAILVGTKTALLDNPHLTARIEGAHNPLRIAIDRDLKIPTSHFLYSENVETLIVHDVQKKPSSQNAHIKFVALQFEKSLLPQLVSYLYEEEILSVIVEGGAMVLDSFLASDQWDEIRVFNAPQSFGTGVATPKIPDVAQLKSKSQIDVDVLEIYLRN